MSGALRPLLERDGCLLHAADSGGAGVPVLFSHGAGADSAMFARQAEALVAGGYRVVLWDLRGHGDSRPAAQPITADRAVADLVAVVEQLGLERPVLIGQSLGGNVSQAVVRRHPGLARALVVLDSTWNTQALSWLDRALLRLALPSLAAIPARRLPRLMASASAATPRGRAYAETAFGRQSKPEFLSAWRATVGLLEADAGYRTPVPLCLLRGEHDRTGDIMRSMPRWAAAEGIREHVIAGAGHLVNVDAPGETNEIILRFLGGLR